MLIAPAAPAPTAMQRMAVNAITGLRCPGAISSPISPVNTTKLITRGFSNAIQSPADQLSTAAGKTGA